MQKKPGREISIDQSALVVKDRQQELLCNTTTELETVNALRRRALAFDLVKCCGFHAMNTYHSELFEHIHQAPPPGYSAVSLAQILRADRAAWIMIAEKITSLKRDPQGALPLEVEIQKGSVASHSIVSFVASSYEDRQQSEASEAGAEKRAVTNASQSISHQACGKPWKGARAKGRGARDPTRKEGDRTSPKDSSTSRSRPMQVRGYAGPSI